LALVALVNIAIKSPATRLALEEVLADATTQALQMVVLLVESVYNLAQLSLFRNDNEERIFLESLTEKIKATIQERTAATFGAHSGSQPRKTA
jgi:hypothetical protein